MTTNPYRAPLVDSFDATQTPRPGDLISSRLEFSGELTPQHHREAVTEAGIRKDFRSVTRTMLALGGLFSLLAILLLLASGDFTGTRVLRIGGASILFLSSIGLFCVHHRWLVGTQIPSYQLAVGHIRGWVDREGLWIESTHHRAYCPLSNLVSSAATDHLWVLNFSKEQTFWQTLPIEGFADPARARATADYLQRICPPLPAQVTDERRRSVPEDDFRFSPGQSAIAFEGQFYEDDAARTRLLKATKRVARRTWAALVVLLVGILSSLLILTNFHVLYVGLAAAWVILVGFNVYFRIWRETQIQDSG